MSLQGALNFISSGGNIGNKVSKVNIWGPNMTDTQGLFYVNSSSITDFFAYLPNATNVNRMMNSTRLNVVDIDIGAAPFNVAGYVLGSTGVNTMRVFKLTSNSSEWLGYNIGAGLIYARVLTDFTFFTNQPLAQSAWLFSPSLGDYMKNININIPNAINAHIFSNNTSSTYGVNLKNLQYINVSAEKVTNLFGNKCFVAGNINSRNDNKIIKGYFPNIISGVNAFSYQKGVNNIREYGIDYTKLQNGQNMFSNSGVDNVSDMIFGSPETHGNFIKMFGYCNNIKEVKNITIYGNSNLFEGCNNIETIDGLIKHSSSTTSSSDWDDCNSLKSINNVRFYVNGEMPRGAFQYAPNLESITNCEFFGEIGYLWYNANKTKVHTLKNINLGVPGTTSSSISGNGFLNSNTLTTVENIYVNFPNNTGNLMPWDMFRNCKNLTSPSNQIFFDVGANAYLDTHNAPPPAWLSGNTRTYMFNGCTNMPDYDLIHANWK